MGLASGRYCPLDLGPKIVTSKAKAVSLHCPNPPFPVLSLQTQGTYQKAAPPNTDNLCTSASNNQAKERSSIEATTCAIAKPISRLNRRSDHGNAAAPRGPKSALCEA